MSALLQVRGLSHHCGRRIGCHDVSFDLHPGELLCIVGESGSGKSTLLNTVAAQLAPTAGTVRYHQKNGDWLDLGALPSEATIPRRPLGVMAALPDELGDLVASMRAEGAVETITHGKRDYHIGTVHGAPCVVTLARVGKVAAAATVSALIHAFDVEAVVFTGVSGPGPKSYMVARVGLSGRPEQPASAAVMGMEIGRAHV